MDRCQSILGGFRGEDCPENPRTGRPGLHDFVLAGLAAQVGFGVVIVVQIRALIRRNV